MRDLAKDLEGIQANPPASYASGWPMEIVMEYLQRAIDAEANNYRADFEHYYELYEELRAENTELKRQLFNAETRYQATAEMVEILCDMEGGGR